MKHHMRPSGMPPVNGYSHTVATTGPLIFVSGQLPLDSDGNLVGQNNARKQIDQVFSNLAAALEAAGSHMDRVVKLTVFLTDLSDLAAFREVRDTYLRLDAPPSSSLVQVSALVHPEARVEIEAIAEASPEPQVLDPHQLR
ncbi:RidA family protein [Streptomyces sp. NPDC056061]|uniref:RidA family protein n=1 Tax=Streptomyces sp. NPDC056061 TaxID=3345700 RepID=UPI0035D790B6